MFVGDVRCATTGSGTSWKLSGGRKLSSSEMNSSKNRHVRRAADRSASASDCFIVRWPDKGGGALVQRAARGDKTQRTPKGSATGQAPCPNAIATAPTLTAKAKLAEICVIRLRGSSPFCEVSCCV